MNYFVTGATGFIGRNLVERLLQREGTIYALVRAGSRGRLEELRTGWGADGARIVPVAGDLSQPSLGVSEEDLVAMRGEVDHFFHLAAIYDIDRRRRGAGGRQRRGHQARDRAGGRDRGGLLPPGQLDRRGRPLPRRMARGHVRRGRTARHQPLLPHQARVRAAGPRGVPAALARLPARDRRRRLAHAARSTRSTAPTTSSSRCSRCGGCCPPGCRRSASKAARSTSSRSTTSPTAIDHIAHKPKLDGRAFHLTDPNPKTRRRADQPLRQGGRRAADDACAWTPSMTEPASGLAPHGAEALPAGASGSEDGPGSARHLPADGPQLHQLPDPLRLDRGRRKR